MCINIYAGTYVTIVPVGSRVNTSYIHTAVVEYEQSACMV